MKKVLFGAICFVSILFVSILFVSCGDDACKGEDVRVTDEACNGTGYIREVCIEGEWVYLDCFIECSDGDTKNEGPSCGINNNGKLKQICENKTWINTEECVDPDECKNGDTSDSSCGLNDRGTLTITCTNGSWKEGKCSDPDECEDGKKDHEGGNCGELIDGKYTGAYERTCVEGRWEKGDCILTEYKSVTCDIGTIECKAGVPFVNGRRFNDCKDCWETTPSGTNCVMSGSSYSCGGCTLQCY